MANNKVKFEMAIEKITFKFEGDYEQGRALQQGINQTMSGLANLQNRAMGMEDTNGRKLIESKPVDPIPPLRRRRRRKNTSSVGGGNDSEIQPGGDNGNDEDVEPGEANDGDQAQRRATGLKPTKLLLELRKSGFFSERRSQGQVVDELHRRGFAAIQGSDISGKLAKFVQKDVLRRDQNEQGNWLYSEGSNTEPPQQS